MPARDRPPAKFGAIPPDLDLRRLVEETDNFRWVDRISCTAIDEQGLDAFEKTVNFHCINKGIPLIVDGWQNKLESWTFSAKWLKDNHGHKFEQARNLSKQENLPLSMAHYLDNMSKLTEQWNHFNYKEAHRQRLYLKDIDCPDVWHEKLKQQMPSSVFYLNESTGEAGGIGSVEEKIPGGFGTRKGKGVAHAGDLMSSLPAAMRAENLMCYIGHEGTYTPAHREMCASLGQNIMVEASGNLDDQGKRTKPGSSIWFMTETADRQVVAEYWLSVLGHDIEVEKHFAHINAWRKAPFTVYVVEQKVGDLILIPPLAPHQVWNRGTRTMKVAWNRTTVDTLFYALDEALPRARLVCRDEQYKNKSIVLFTLNKYYTLLDKVEIARDTAPSDEAREALIRSPKMKQLRRDFKRLWRLFDMIVMSESFSPDLPQEKKVEYVAYDSNVTCSYCRCNIFNRFLTCRHCVVPLADGSDDTYDICMDCYAMGRSCKCIGKLEWVEQFPWNDLIEKHEIWRKMYIQLDGGMKDTSPQPFHIDRKFVKDRTVAEICQLELRKRPFKDPRKPEPESEPSDDSDDADVTASGAPKKSTKKKKRSEKSLSENLPCHFCCYRHPKWKEAICITCGAAYCFGTLWRGFDMMPNDVLKNKTWECPRCLKICTCTKCRAQPGNRAQEPSGTLLGHNTQEFADPRSVESLVDFGVSNRRWIKKSGDGDQPEENRRLQRRQAQAMTTKESLLQPEDDDEDGEGEPYDQTPPEEQPESPDSRPGTSDDDIPIDPALTGGSANWAELSTRYPRHSQTQSQASRALEAMNGLSRLEQDPEAFMTQAGLGPDGREDDSLFVAPTAPMRDNGYDELGSQQLDGVAFSTPQANGSGKDKGKKRNRKSAPPKVVSDAPTQDQDPFAPNIAPSAANQRFQMQAEKQRMNQAKKSKGVFAARAAIRGLTANVTLKVPPTILAQFPAGSSRDPNPEVRPEGNAPAEDEDVPVVESNLPKSVPAIEAKARNPKVPKKRVRDEDLDEDFAAVPSRDRRTQKQVRESRRTALEDQTVQEISDDDPMADSSDDDALPADGNGAIIGTASKQRRSLPNYLAQRPADPDAPLPKELGNEPRSRGNRTEYRISPGSQLSQRMPVENSATVRAREEANRQAKLRAAEGISDAESEPEADGDTEDISDPEPMPKKQKLVDPVKSVSISSRGPSRGGLSMRGGPGRGSIFAGRGRGGKIKISSAKKV